MQWLDFWSMRTFWMRRGSLGRCVLVGLVSVVGLVGCKDLTGNSSLPAGTQNPSYYSTPAGALGMRVAAITALEIALPGYITDTGLLADELESNQTGAVQTVIGSSALSPAGSLDERYLPEQGYGSSGTAADNDYGALQQVRGLTIQALGALATYDTGAVQQGDPVALRGELYVLEGYTEILIADFFCSGVPLSTLDFQHDFTYHVGESTTQVYQDALAKLDSGYRLASARDSTRLQNMALVLKGRAFLDLGQYDSAANAVAAIPEGFSYQLSIQNASTVSSPGSHSNFINGTATISNGEGVNGLPFLDGDPRTVADTIEAQCAQGCNFVPIALTFPVKYQSSLSGTGFTPFLVADWVEARLIQAEAALHGVATGQGSWLEQLNAVRADTTLTATLPQLTDPGAHLQGAVADSARVKLLFQERAYWLFLTGHRQGDLRRLVRQYGFSQDHVYPTGVYLAPGIGSYGTYVNAPIPGTEYINPLFHGCLDRNA